MDEMISRRNLLRAGGVVTGGVLLGGGLAAPASAASLADPDVAVVPPPPPPPPRFDLSAASTQMIRETSLADGTVLQSFAIDNVNGRIYWAQRTDKSEVKDGNITITKTTLDGTLINGKNHVYLTGFGHGTQIAVQPVGDDAYVWVEAAVDLDKKDGFGTKIARFQFKTFPQGATLKTSTPGVEIYDPAPGGTHKSIAIDPAAYGDEPSGRVAIRYLKDGNLYHRLYNLETFADHDYTRLAEVNMGAATLANNQDFQGFTTFGGFLYTLTGTFYSDGYGNIYDGKLADGSYVDGNVHIRAYDWNGNGVAVDDALTKAGYTLTYREPEGMAVRMSNPSDLATARLCFGFASGEQDQRKASIYYKQGFN